MSPKKIGVLYIPVIHSGYVRFLRELEECGVEELYIVSDEILASHEELDYINRKDRLRALSHGDVCTLIAQLTSIPVHSLTIATTLTIPRERVRLIMPDEDINKIIAEIYFSGYTIEYKNVFLRWHKDNVGENVSARGVSVTTLSLFAQTMFSCVLVESMKSADWWRQVGAALVKDGELIGVAHNEHMPEKELPNILGDTRALFTKGVNVNYVTTAHAEASVIAEAARKGISTDGAELFTTDFPCPYCARVIAKSGIKKIYFVHGYAVLGGEEFFKDVGIETVKVDVGE